MNIAEAARRSDWLNALKPGDEVAATRRPTGGFSRGITTIEKVAKLTPTQVVLENGWRFDRARNVGSLLDRDARGDIAPVTQTLRDSIEMVELGRWLSTLPAGPTNGWKNPPLHLMRAMKEAYDKAGEQHANSQGFD